MFEVKRFCVWWFGLCFGTEGRFNFEGKCTRLKIVFLLSGTMGRAGVVLISRVSVLGKRFCFCGLVLIFNLKRESVLSYMFVRFLRVV